MKSCLWQQQGVTVGDHIQRREKAKVGQRAPKHALQSSRQEVKKVLFFKALLKAIAVMKS
jgi:hypothetical protein